MTFITPTLLDLSVLTQSKRIKGVFILYFGNLGAGYSAILAGKGLRFAKPFWKRHIGLP